MPDPARRNARRSPSRLYRSGKISDYRFRKVLAHFARDHSATDTAEAVGLSVNSVHTIFKKMRVFFFEVGLFRDFYEGRDPLSVESHLARFEYGLLEFHFSRVRDKRGLRSLPGAPDYHFAESCWRYDFKVLMDERPTDAIHVMMQAHLLEVIRLCGPLGRPPRNRAAGLRVVARHIDQRVLWLSRNAPGFALPAQRAALKDAASINPDSDATVVPGESP